MRYLIILAVLTLFFSGCDGYEKIEFRGVSNLKLGKIEGKKMALSFDAKLYNPNGYGIKIKPSDLDLYIGDAFMGVINLDKSVKFKRKREATVHIPVSIELNPGAILKLASIKLKSKVDVRLKGDVKGSVWGITKKQHIDETRPLSLKDLDLNLPF